MKMIPYLNIDTCLLKWLTLCRDKNSQLIGTILLENAIGYAQLLGYNK